MANKPNESAPGQTESQHVGIADKLVFSIPEVCEVSGSGKTKIYAEIRDGRLVARKMGDKTIILRRDLLAWLDALPRGLDQQRPWLEEAKQRRRAASHEVTV